MTQISDFYIFVSLAQSREERDEVWCLAEMGAAEMALEPAGHAGFEGMVA